MKNCIKCGEEKEESLFKTPSKCKKCCNDYDKQWRKDNKEKYHLIQNKNIRTPKRRFAQAKRKAENKTKEWTLSFQEFDGLIKQPCYYCNGFFPKTEVGSGLDRLDSSIGYTFVNVVSSCGLCNKLKGDFLTVEETKILIGILIKLRMK